MLLFLITLTQPLESLVSSIFQSQYSPNPITSHLSTTTTLIQGEWGGREAQEGGAIYIRIADSLCCTAETQPCEAIIFKQYNKIFKKRERGLPGWSRDEDGAPNAGVQVQSLVRALEPACHSGEFMCCN